MNKDYTTIEMDNKYHSMGVKSVDHDNSDLNKKIIGTLLDVNYQSILRFKEVPGIWTHTIGGDIVDLNAIGTFLSSHTLNGDASGLFPTFAPSVASIFELIKDEVKLASVIGKIFYDRNGLIRLNNASITFEMMRHSIMEADAAYKGATSYLIAMLLNPIRIKLKLNAPSNVVSTFEKKETMYPTKSELIHTFQIEEYIRILKEVDYDFLSGLETKGSVSVGAIASGLSQAFNKIFFKLNSLERIANSYAAVLALVKAHLTQDYSSYKIEQRVIFEDTRFLQLCSIMTIAQQALEHKTNIPNLGDNYWMQCIETISSHISGTSRLELVDLAAIKELYTIDHIHDPEGFRKGVVVSRNIVESGSFEAFKARPISKDNVMLYKDTLIENIFSGVYNLARTIDSSVVHEFAVGAMATTISSSSEYFAYTIGIQSEEIGIISYLLAKRRFILQNDRTGEYEMIFEFTTDNSLITSEMKLFLGRGLTRNPLILLLYCDSFKGGKAITTYDKDVFKDHKSSLYYKPAVQSILNRNLKGKNNVLMKQFVADGKKQFRVTLKFDEMLHLYGMDEVVMRTPILGNKIISSLLTVRNHLAKVLFEHLDKRPEVTDAISAAEDALRYKLAQNQQTPTEEQIAEVRSKVLNQATYKEASNRLIDMLDINLIRIFHPIVDCAEIDDLKRALITRIWSASEDLQKTKISNSILTTRDVDLEFKVRVAFFVISELGFMDGHEAYGNMLKRFSESNLYARLMV